MLRLHRPARDETDVEQLLVIVSSAGAAAAWLWLRVGLPTPRCNLYTWTGIPCPTCGTTRAVRGFLTGDWALAWSSNPLVFTGLLVWCAIMCYALIVVCCKLPRLRIQTVLTPRVVLTAGGLVLLINWLYLLTN